MDDLTIRPEYGSFSEAVERLKHVSGDVTYWLAREIQPVLAYARWEDFEEVISRARMACGSAGTDPDNQFRETAQMVPIGSGAVRERKDFFLSRYACYLIAMSGDSSKPEIGYAKMYFAVQTRRQELDDQATANQKRLLMRNRVKDANKNLNAAAKAAGVQQYAVFHDAGYKGLYGGLGQAQIKAQKGIPETEALLDCIDRTELAANAFRITQTEEKLRRERIGSEPLAIQTHRTVGEAVRETISKLGGTMPETLPAAPPIKKVLAEEKKRLRAATAKKLP